MQTTVGEDFMESDLIYGATIVLYETGAMLWYFIFDKNLSPLVPRAPVGIPGPGGEGSGVRLARGVRAPSRDFGGATPPSPSPIPQRRAQPGAEGERERWGEGTGLLISSLRQQTDSGDLEMRSILFQIASYHKQPAYLMEESLRQTAIWACFYLSSVFRSHHLRTIIWSDS